MDRLRKPAAPSSASHFWKKKNSCTSFGHGSDGKYPVAALVAANDTLYETTVYGGAYDNRDCYGLGCGIVFSMSLGGSEQLLNNFGLINNDGAWPEASLIDVNGTLYQGGVLDEGTVSALTL